MSFLCSKKQPVLLRDVGSEAQGRFSTKASRVSLTFPLLRAGRRSGSPGFASAE